MNSKLLIVPLTTQRVDQAEPLRVRIEAQGSHKKDSDLIIDKLSAIDNKRLVPGPLTILTQEQLALIYHAVSEVLGMALLH